MHAQIKASPDDTAENVQRILNALAAAEASTSRRSRRTSIRRTSGCWSAHEDMDNAMSALSDAGLTPEIKSALRADDPGRAQCAEEGRRQHRPPRPDGRERPHAREVRPAGYGEGVDRRREDGDPRLG